LAKRYIVEETVDIPESIDVSVEGRQVSVTGPLGKLERDFSHAPVTIHLGDGVTEARWPDKKAGSRGIRKVARPQHDLGSPERLHIQTEICSAHL
jgi:ribosomal protein L6P/L9E